MYLGFDIGGSSIKAALVQKNKIVGTRYERLPENFNDFIKTIVSIKEDLSSGINSKDIRGVGFSIAGALDKKREKMLLSCNIPYLSGKNLYKILSQKLAPLPIKIERDAYCFLIAESLVGKGKRYKYIFYLTLGTGIGGAFMLDGKIVTGFHGSAGEVGHTIVDVNKGSHWEDLGANKFIKNQLGVRFSQAEQLVSAGNKDAIKMFRRLGGNIGIGIANIINSFDPEVIILSGGIAAAKKLMIADINKAINKNVISKDAKKTKLLWSNLGRFGGALGAALLFEK